MDMREMNDEICRLHLVGAYYTAEVLIQRQMDALRSSSMNMYAPVPLPILIGAF